MTTWYQRAKDKPVKRPCATDTANTKTEESTADEVAESGLQCQLCMPCHQLTVTATMAKGRHQSHRMSGAKGRWNQPKDEGLAHGVNSSNKNKRLRNSPWLKQTTTQCEKQQQS